MRIMGLTMPIEAVGFAFMHGLPGAGEARRVMIVSITGTQWLVRLPLAWLVGLFLGFGLLGVWLLQGGGRALQSFLFAEMWRGRKWRHIEV
jgi:Na+-driven multidrug efflux pump